MHVYFKPHPYAALLPCEKKKSIKGEKDKSTVSFYSSWIYKAVILTAR